MKIFHNQIVATSCLLTVLLLSCSEKNESEIVQLSSGIQTDEKNNSGKVQLSANIQKDDKGEFILIKLTNGSDKKIVVDGQLVIFISIKFVFKSEQSVQNEGDYEKLPKDIASYWNKRIVTILPGDKLSRIIRFKDKTKIFFCNGTASDINGRISRVQGVEEWYEFPAKEELKSIGITYGDAGYLRGAARFYLGSEMPENLYNKHHSITVAMD